jgi:hypothetical protein
MRWVEGGFVPQILPCSERRAQSRASALLMMGFVTLSYAGCDIKRSQPIDPSPAGTTVVDLRIAGPSALLIGQTAGYSATSVYSDGTSATAAAAWISATPDVAEISSGGQLTAWTAGTTVISASFEGRAATLAIQIKNPLVGQWLLAAGNPGAIGRSVKSFTETEWEVSQPNPATGGLLYRHGGHYTLRGTEYAETVEFANASTAQFIGRTFAATVTAEANRFTQATPGQVTEEWTRTSD